MTALGLSLTGVGLAGVLWADARQSRAAVPLKLVASSGFLLVAAGQGGWESAYGRWIIVGLVLCWVGDAALLGRSDAAFLLGLGAFLLGHVAYIGAFLSTDLVPTVATSVFGLAWLAIAIGAARWLWPHVTPRMRGPVVAYIVAISAMVVLSGPAGVGRTSVLPPTGAALFAVSDIAVARNRFVAPGFGNRAWGLPLYYVGQVFIALSV